MPVSLDCPFYLLTLRFSLTIIYKQFDHAINQNIIQYEFLIELILELILQSIIFVLSDSFIS